MGSENTVNFSINTSPYFHSALLFCDCLLYGNQVISASYPFLGLLLPGEGLKYSYTNSYILAMTLMSQDDHLTAGAWADFHSVITYRYLAGMIEYSKNRLFYTVNIVKVSGR